MTSVVSACYGASDDTHPQAIQDVDCDWLLFTDRPCAAPAPWQVIVEPARFAHPCMAAKWFKLFPPGGDVVWVDASIEVTAPGFVREALAARRDGLAVWRHPVRDCIFEEAGASLSVEEHDDGKYLDQPLREQAESYRAEGHPAHGGLYACGAIAWDVAASARLREAWWAEIMRWSWQDQLSLPVVCRRLGVTPGIFPVEQVCRWDGWAQVGPWATIHPHRRH